MRARKTKIVDGVTLFLCGRTGCNQWLPKSGYYQNATAKNRISSYCKSCLKKVSNTGKISKLKKEVEGDIEIGKRCSLCTIQFNLPNGYPVVCADCLKRSIRKKQNTLPLSRLRELNT